MNNEALTRILSARFVTCNEQARRGRKNCANECKLYCLQEPGMTCRDSVLLHRRCYQAHRYCTDGAVAAHLCEAWPGSQDSGVADPPADHPRQGGFLARC